MFLKAVTVVTLFTNLLGATDIFSVRSFIDPKTKAKLPITGQLFGGGDPQLWVAQAGIKNDKCAIPLLAAKPGRVNDHIAQFFSPNHDTGSIMLPPMPACKGWK